jgi:hypothetical protein
VGSWVVASKSGSRISRANKCGRKESSVDLLVDTQADGIAVLRLRLASPCDEIVRRLARDRILIFGR